AAGDTRAAGERKRGEKLCARHANVRRGGRELFLSRAYIRTALQQPRWQPSRNFRRRGLFGQRLPARYGVRILANEGGDEILLQADLTLRVGYGFGRSLHKLLGLAHIQQRGGAAVGQRFGQLERFAARGQRVLGDAELQIELAHLEICDGDVRDERSDDLLAIPLRGEKVGARRLGCAAVLAPEIRRPGDQRLNLEITERKSRQPLTGKSRTGVDGGELTGARDSHLRLRLENAAGGDLHVVVILQTGSNQIL